MRTNRMDPAHGTRSKVKSPVRATDNQSIAEAFERLALLLETEGESDDRVRPWRRTASAIRASPRQVAELLAERGVEGIHDLGIDYVVAGRVADLLRSGRFPILDRLEARSACGTVFERLPGIGPKLAREVREVLGVHSLDGLARAAQDGTLEGVCGFGPKRSRLLASILAPRERRATAEEPTGQLELWAGT